MRGLAVEWFPPLSFTLTNMAIGVAFGWWCGDQIGRWIVRHRYGH